MQDFLIIGGGIAGLGLAAELAGNGSLTLVEAEAHPGWHASGRSAALYEPRYGAPPVVGLSLASEPAFRAAGVLTPRGLLMVAAEDQRSAFYQDLEAMHFTEIHPEAALEHIPILNPARLQYAAYAAHADDIDTDLLLQSCLRKARAAGAQITVNARVAAISRISGGWRVTWPGGVAEARVLINAAGAWVDQIAAMAAVASPGFTPLRRSMARIPAPAGMDVSRWPMLFGPGEDWYMKPDAGALIVSPAEEDPVQAPHDAWADDMVLAEGLARYEAAVTSPVTRLLASWAGLRTFARDRVPVIGFAAQAPGFFWLAGQGGYGFQTNPAASRLAADLILGRSPEIDAGLVTQLSPARFG